MFGRNFTRQGQRGGKGVGFRGSSSAWPYVGLGRGGLPRCGRFSRGGAVSTAQRVGYGSFAEPLSKEAELSNLNKQAQTLRKTLEEIESKVKTLSEEGC
jgi:hypothetical protein